MKMDTDDRGRWRPANKHLSQLEMRAAGVQQHDFKSFASVHEWSNAGNRGCRLRAVGDAIKSSKREAGE